MEKYTAEIIFEDIKDCNECPIQGNRTDTCRLQRGKDGYLVWGSLENQHKNCPLKRVE